MRWVEVGDRAFAWRCQELDQTLGLVVGDSRCLVVDTGTDEVHGRQFVGAIRGITSLPWTVVLTHSHFDHIYGTAAFAPCHVWAHERCRDAMADATDRDAWVARYRDEGKAAQAERLARARLVLPDHLLTDRVALDLGNRTVELVHPGRGHTDHDVVVHVDDIVFAGDLVEQGAAPQAGPDAVVADWAATLDVVLAMEPRTVVPGHGEPVDPGFVRAQRDVISAGLT